MDVNQILVRSKILEAGNSTELRSKWYRGWLVRYRYSRSSTGSNIIKGGTIDGPRIVVRDGEEQQVAWRVVHVCVSSRRCSRRRGGCDRSAKTGIRDTGLDRDRGRACRRELEDDSKGG